MAHYGGLVDLSLFATSPTDDHQFAVDDLAIDVPSTRERIFRARAGDVASTRYAHPLPRSYTMKPLPPLPSRKLCRTRGSGGRPDFTSRCILTRMKRAREDDQAFSQAVTIQQRRSGPTVTAPQLTLSLPSIPTPSHPRRTASAMIWMPEEQMWLTADEITDQWHDHPLQHRSTDPTHQNSAYIENTFQYYQPEYPRSEPSPGPYAYYDLSPPESPIMSQLRTLLVEPRDEERLSPLFQAAVQTVPMIEMASLYSQHLYEPDESEPEPDHGEGGDSERSRQQSFHSAIDFLADGPTRSYRRNHSGWSSQARNIARSHSAMA
ncbi:MAG: hypothetical protein LQ352_004581 [Teloschistes flavicans]|nr:MAG: hypothetical protein LQ352_004581 [Teloschistes flavicans]